MEPANGRPPVQNTQNYAAGDAQANPTKNPISDIARKKMASLTPPVVKPIGENTLWRQLQNIAFELVAKINYLYLKIITQNDPDKIDLHKNLADIAQILRPSFFTRWFAPESQQLDKMDVFQLGAVLFKIETAQELLKKPDLISPQIVEQLNDDQAKIRESINNQLTKNFGLLNQKIDVASFNIATFVKLRTEIDHLYAQVMYTNNLSAFAPVGTDDTVNPLTTQIQQLNEQLQKNYIAKLDNHQSHFDEKLKSNKNNLTVENFATLSQELDAAYAQSLGMEALLGCEPKWSTHYLEQRKIIEESFKNSKTLKGSMDGIKAEIDALTKGNLGINESLDLQKKLQAIWQYNCYAIQHAAIRPDLQLTPAQRETYSECLLLVNAHLAVANTTPQAATVSSTGLVNLGNTCWMNSSLQSLNASGLLVQIIARANSDQQWLESHPYHQRLIASIKPEEAQGLPGNLPALWQTYKTNLSIRPLLFGLSDDYALHQELRKTGAYGALQTIHRALNEPTDIQRGELGAALQTLSTSICAVKTLSAPQAAPWIPGNQQDAEEFVNLLMRVLNFKPVTMQSSSTFTLDNIQQTKQYPIEATTICQINFLSGTNNLQELFNLNFEPVKNENTPLRVNDRVVLEFNQKSNLTALPEILPLQMKRFVAGGAKNTTRVGLNPDDDGNFKLNAATALEKNNGAVAYKAVSFVLHMGGTGGGHYVSYYKKDAQWYYASDSDVHPVNDIKQVQNALSESYMIFFQKESTS